MREIDQLERVDLLPAPSGLEPWPRDLLRALESRNDEGADAAKEDGFWFERVASVS